MLRSKAWEEDAVVISWLRAVTLSMLRPACDMGWPPWTAAIASASSGGAISLAPGGVVADPFLDLVDHAGSR